MISGSIPFAPQATKCSPPGVAPLPERIHLTNQHCSVCELWLANPLGHLQSLVRIPESLQSLPVQKPIATWRLGAERRCVLCELVKALCQNLEQQRDLGYPREVQLLVSPIQRDFPHFIHVVGYNSEGGARVRLWEVELYSTRDTQTPLPGLPVRRNLPSEFGSTECLDLVKAWLRECQTTHTGQGCELNRDQPLPTRVLDINSDPPRLVLTSGECGRFVALSHCWGNSSVQPPRTLGSNLEEHCGVGVADSHLSATFRDAITMSKRLGYRYIWIDSLCIIQDDLEDWEHESGLMASVYGRADLVVGATSAADGSHGFLGPRSGYFQDTVYLPTHSESGDASWTICYSPCLPHNSYVANQEAFRPANEGPLESRAWAFQERLLARRFVSFGMHEICWECNSILECECLSCGLDPEKFSPRSLVPVHRKYNLQRKLKQDIGSTQLHGAWRTNIVVPYTERRLTKSTDRLVALSAIAFEFSKRLSDQYLAGIWRDDLQRGLLWRSHEISNAPVIGAPSWSWASVQGRISWPKNKLDPAVCLGDVRVKYATLPGSAFGRPCAASITFQANIMDDARLLRRLYQGSGSGRTSTYQLSLPAGNVLQLYVDTNVEPIQATKEDGRVITSARRRRGGGDDTNAHQQQSFTYRGVYCLQIAPSIGLVLGPASSKSATFERLGLCFVQGVKIRNWKKRTMTIV